MADPIQQDRVAAAIAMLPSKYRVLPGWQKLMTAIFTRANEIEKVFFQILLARYLPTATGVQLDAIGAIVGRARLGMDDDTYRLWLGAQILLLVGSGAINDVYDVLDAVNDGAGVTFSISQFYPRSFIVRASAPLNLASQQGALVQKAKSATINAQLIAPTVAAADTFTWGDTNQNGGAPVSTSTQGWGDSANPSAGGRWASSY